MIIILNFYHAIVISDVVYYEKNHFINYHVCLLMKHTSHVCFCF